MKTAFCPRFPLSSLTFVLAGFVALAGTRIASAEDRRFILAIDMTQEGKAIKAPTPEHPTYYYPIYLGYQEMGAVLDYWERKPADEEGIKRTLAEALAKQGYLPATDRFSPSLALTFRWGSIAPISSQGVRSLGGSQLGQGLPPRSRHLYLNDDEIHTYIAGANWRDVHRRDPNGREILSLKPRHFLMVSALDFAAYNQQKEVLLWRAHVSTTAWGNYLDEVLGALITTAAPRFGHETMPNVVWAPLDPTGKVVVGQVQGKGPTAGTPVLAGTP